LVAMAKDQKSSGLDFAAFEQKRLGFIICGLALD